MHVDIEPTQIGRVFDPDFGIVSDAKAALELFVDGRKGVAQGRQAQRSSGMARRVPGPQAHHAAQEPFRRLPIKPQRVYEEMNKAFGRDTCYVSVIGLSQIAGAQFLGVYRPRNWINCGQAGPLGWTLPAALGVRAADPDREIVALSGDYDFQFLIEELAVGAQFKLPYIHVVVNNSYLGLIRQAQRGFDMDFQVSCRSTNINAPELASTASIMSPSPRALAAKRSASPIRTMRRQPSRRRANGWRNTGACRRRIHPRTGHQHRDGDRDRRHRRVRGSPRSAAR